MLKELTQHLHGHVFKGQRRAVGQLQQRYWCTLLHAQRRERCNGLGMEGLLGVGRGRQALDHLEWEVIGEPMHDPCSQLGVAQA